MEQLDLKIKGSIPFSWMFTSNPYFGIMSAVKDVNRKGLSIKRITLPIDLSSKKTFCRNV